jgi:sn-glycerol 3-phosphate transport system permease protein
MTELVLAPWRRAMPLVAWPRLLVRLARLPRLPYLLLLPSLVFLVLFTYGPILQVLWGSVHRQLPLQPTAIFVGLGNYERLFADTAFRISLLNNLLYAIGTVVPSLVLALAFALMLRASTTFTSIVRAILFFPTLVPLVAIAALFSFIFLPRIGLLDYYLARFGAESINWIGDPDLALYSLAAMTVWKNVGYYMLFFLAGLQSIPADAEEAATLDGASLWQRLRYVLLPMLKPTIAFVTVIALINAITLVDHVVVLTKGGPNNATNLLLFYIYQTAAENNDWGKAAAATVASVAILLLLSLAGLRTLDRSHHDDA